MIPVMLPIHLCLPDVLDSRHSQRLHLVGQMLVMLWLLSVDALDAMEYVVQHSRL